MKNYYKILGLEPNTDEESIKKAYRILAKRYHPDVNPDSSIAAAKFRDVTEAYDTLSDGPKRRQYDAMLGAFLAQQTQQSLRQQQQQAAPRPTAFDPRRGGTASAMQAAAQAAYEHGRAQAQQTVNETAQASYLKGYQQGFSDAKAGVESDLAKYRKDAAAARDKIDKLDDKIESLDGEMSVLKDENTWLESRLKERDAKLKDLEQSILENAGRSKRREGAEMQALNEASRKDLLNAQAQIDLQREKRMQAEEALKRLQKRVEELEEEIGRQRETIAEWEAYAKTEEFISDLERKRSEWDNKIKADKKRAKNTVYGTLGVMLWASDAEILESYKKLVGRYQKNQDDPKNKERLYAVRDAYKVLTSGRAEYDRSIGLEEEESAREQALYKEYEAFMEEYRTQMAEQEFWKFVDELTYNAQTGDADAQNTLGEMYYYGDELEQDLSQAVYWFKEGAKQGKSEALFNLGVCYYNGEGVQKDVNKGLGFIKQADKLGSASAKEYLALCGAAK